MFATIASLALGVGSTAAQSPPPIFTKNAALRLPVQLDERSRAEVAQVKLYVRGPSGRWECVQTAPSSQTAFDFRAPADGEYLFTFVTVDRRGNANPPSVETAPSHRAVVVDTTPPDVAAQPIPVRGERAIQCQVRDANPDMTSLKVAYLSADNTWQPLALMSPDTPTVFRVPNAGVLESKIRVTVADRAGNRTVREIDLGDPTAPLGLPKAAVDKGKPDPALFQKDELANPVAPPIPDAGVRGAGYAELPKAPRNDFKDLPPLPEIKPDTGADVPPPLKIPDPPVSKMPDVRPPLKAAGDDYKIPDLPGLPADVPPIKPPTDVPPPPAIPPVRSTSTKPSDSGIPPINPPRTDRDPGTKPVVGSHPILNTRTCTVNYQLDGPTRFPNRIDFWATADGGRSWAQVKDLNGGIPPAKLMLPGDGVFGIRIRPGGGAKPPEAMEDPDCVVEVDTTKPVVSLAAPALVEDGVMVIGWTASDDNLLGNSINLYYAPKPAGPWEVIVTGYKNTGEYKWALPPGLTGSVYLRVEASDRAGNVGRYELPTPVALESGKQRVKVIGVGPAQ
jgi:hypothetical protein